MWRLFLVIGDRVFYVILLLFIVLTFSLRKAVLFLDKLSLLPGEETDW